MRGGWGLVGLSGCQLLGVHQPFTDGEPTIPNHLLTMNPLFPTVTDSVSTILAFFSPVKQQFKPHIDSEMTIFLFLRVKLRQDFVIPTCI